MCIRPMLPKAESFLLLLRFRYSRSSLTLLLASPANPNNSYVPFRFSKKPRIFLPLAHMSLFVLFLMSGVFSSIPAHALAPVQEVVTKNGVKAWLIEDHALKLVTLRAAFTGAGSSSDPKGKEGLADLAASLLDEGAGDLKSLGFAEALAGRAIRWNAGSSEDALTVTVETLSENVGEAAHLMGLALTHPRFDEDAIARMRAAALAALAQADQQPDTIAARALRKAVFGTHAYAREAYTDAKSVKAITRGDLVGYAQKRLTRANMVIAVVGDITPATLQALLEKEFAALPKGEKAAPFADAELPRKPETIRIRRDIPQTVVQFAGPGLLRRDPDYLATYVLNHAVGGDGLNSRLTDAIREQRGLAYYVSSELVPLMHAGLLGGGFATRADQADAAIRVFRETLSAVRDRGITQAELDEAKQYLAGSFPLRIDSNAELAGYLVTMQQFALGKDYIEKRNALIDSVTLEQANRLAKTLYDPERMTIVAVGAQGSDAQSPVPEKNMTQPAAKEKAR